MKADRGQEMVVANELKELCRMIKAEENFTKLLDQLANTHIDDYDGDDELQDEVQCCADNLELDDNAAHYLLHFLESRKLS